MDYGMWNDRTNMSMLTDFYELTMANGYLNSGNRDKVVYFDMFFRNIPENGGYAVMAGLEQVIDYIKNLLDEIELDFDAFVNMYGKEKIKDAVLYGKDLKDRYTVLWLYYQFCK